MKFYKIVNPKGHNGLVYHEGLNIDPLPFNPSGSCEPGGIYFAREDILAFLDYGTELYEVEPVGDEVYENPSKVGEPKKWKAKQLNMKYIGNVWDNIPFLIEQGANTKHLSVGLNYAAKKGNLDIVKYLVEQGADIHSNGDNALSWAATNGHLDVVKYLVENGADIHAFDDCALRLAAMNGHLEVVKYLVEQVANIHVYGDEALRWTSSCYLNIIKYLVKQGAKISVIVSKKLRLQCYIYRTFGIWLGKK